MPNIIFWIYIIVSGANLAAQVIPSEELNQFTKPLLMPLLIFYVYRSSQGMVTGRILLLCLALLLSWFGDIALMYQGATIYFMIGIGFFLMAQITYIIVLSKSSYQKLTFDPIRVLPFVVYGVGLFRFLLPNAGDFQIPIFIYGIVILMMVSTARLRESNASQNSYRLALYGSILFVLSDSLIAINKFYMEIPQSGLLIMATYVTAQFLLVKGVLNHAD
jgi:uncharacterized membrane protein YhhN